MEQNNAVFLNYIDEWCHIVIKLLKLWNQNQDTPQSKKASFDELFLMLWQHPPYVTVKSLVIITYSAF